MSQHTNIAPARPSSDPGARRTTGLSASKKWVLPPRPKPGRKPKPRDPPTAAELQVRPGIESELATQLSPVSAVASPAHGGARTDPSGSSSPAPAPAPVTQPSELNTSANADADAKADCGLCTRQECICSDIGIKPSTPAVPAASAAPAPSMVPTLDAILSSYPARIEAVPLKRTRATTPKQGLKRASAAPAPLHDHAKYEPPVFDGNCGFCTDDSSCICSQQVRQSVLTPVDSVASSPRADTPLRSPSPLYGEDAEECVHCQDALSMLFCLSLRAAAPLRPEAVAIPHHLALRTLRKHGRFETCDLGRLVKHLEVDDAKMVGVQSINQALHDLDSGLFS